MALPLLLDECIQAKMLVELLKSAGHSVFTASEVGLQGYSDKTVIDYAVANDLIVLTINCDDFVRDGQWSNHPGVLLVYQYDDTAKNMSYSQIVQAVENLESSGVQLMNICHVLNRYNY